MTNIDQYTDPRVIAAIERLRFSEDAYADAEVPGLDVVLIRIRETLDEETTFSIRYRNEFVVGFGIRCYTEPAQIDVVSIRSGFDGNDRAWLGAAFDVAFFSTGEICPFDLGCFSNLGPLTMTFRPVVKGTKLEMILVGQKVDVSKAFDIKAGTPPIGRVLELRCTAAGRSLAGEVELGTAKPKPFGDPGWIQATANGMNVAVFSDASPIRPFDDDAAAPALHGVVGTAIRRGPFALQIWVGDGSPRRVVGLRPFNAAGMFKIQGIFNSLERRTILYGVEIDIADLGGEAYAEFDMGVCSRDKPLLIEFDNITPHEAAATLNVVFVSVPVGDK